ncbi:hypothetical protein H0H92_005585 [Tricholoma furcatifolium]|nr:hypothetical protein H0H92_005585 [Tricholoma furcatifolium]
MSAVSNIQRRSTLNIEPGVQRVPPNSTHDRTISSLNVAVQLISLVNNFLTPVPLAKGVLGSISGILDIIKTTYANQGDFQDIIEQCQIVVLTVWHATKGTTDRGADSRVEHSLSRLQNSVKSIQDAIEQKAKSSIASKIFHSSLNKETIGKWKSDMVPDEVPPRPVAFVGRDAIVQDTVQHLLKCSKVALIGPGGIGKSSIARAILNEVELIAKFQQQRFFVLFDDMDALQVTYEIFLERIAKVLGYNASFNTYNMISRILATSETLLVLDNAETFLDAPVDGGRIADVINEFGARPNVAILLTTRTTVLPSNLNWIRMRIPSLEKDAACEAFKISN